MVSVISTAREMENLSAYANRFLGTKEWATSSNQMADFQGFDEIQDEREYEDICENAFGDEVLNRAYRHSVPSYKHYKQAEKWLFDALGEILLSLYEQNDEKAKILINKILERKSTLTKAKNRQKTSRNELLKTLQEDNRIESAILREKVFAYTTDSFNIGILFSELFSGLTYKNNEELKENLSVALSYQFSQAGLLDNKYLKDSVATNCLKIDDFTIIWEESSTLEYDFKVFYKL